LSQSQGFALFEKTVHWFGGNCPDFHEPFFYGFASRFGNGYLPLCGGKIKFPREEKNFPFVISSVGRGKSPAT